jgi:hypothetical protein
MLSEGHGFSRAVQNRINSGLQPLREPMFTRLAHYEIASECRVLFRMALKMRPAIIFRKGTAFSRAARIEKHAGFSPMDSLEISNALKD